MFVFRFADIAQLAEHVIGNDEVGGSNPPISSKAVSSVEDAAFLFCFPENFVSLPCEDPLRGSIGSSRVAGEGLSHYH